MAIPNVSGISFIPGTTTNKNQFPLPEKRRKRLGILTPVQPKIKRFKSFSERRSKLVQDVDLLVTDYNDKAYISDGGQVDIIRGGHIKTVHFPNKKVAALYLLKTGWKYV